MRYAAEQRSELEHLCRYITRPAIANERLSVNHAEQVVLKLKRPYRDSTSHLVMSPLESMQRLAALVPRLRLHLTRFHGVFAPNAGLRAAIVPSTPENSKYKSSTQRDVERQLSGTDYDCLGSGVRVRGISKRPFAGPALQSSLTGSLGRVTDASQP